MDTTKKPLGVVTMVYGDHFFLKRWYDYYAAQVGAENLYIFSHGPDPEHDRIAPGANVIHVPRDPTMYRFDRRRWNMLSQFVSGMFAYYNWMILSDVDEIVVIDPDAAPTILDYMDQHHADYDTAPENIAPLCLELVHYPEDEREPIEDGVPILSRRRTFRPNRNYSKPCLVRSPAKWRAGGHANSLNRRHLPDHMYLLHLKYFDCAVFNDRAETKDRDIRQTDGLGENFARMDSWYQTDAAHQQILDTLPFAGEDIELTAIRQKMLEQVDMGRGRFVYGGGKAKNLYRIPARFGSVF
ncbi:MAG: glycosyltransferase family 2 protein [Paracoccaceae bacterium]